MAFYCHYCGDNADTLDHIIPIAYNYIKRPKKSKSRGGETVHCCRECNSFLGSKALFSIKERASEIAECLDHHYYKELNAPVWSDEEISELGPTLKRQVESRQFLRLEVVERIRNATSVAQGLLEAALPLWDLKILV